MNAIALILVIIGAINWGSIGLFGLDLVGALFGGQLSVISRIIGYILRYQSNKTLIMDKDVEVLFEETKDINNIMYWIGYTKEYVKVAIPEEKAHNLQNKLFKGHICGYLDNEIMLMV